MRISKKFAIVAGLALSFATTQTNSAQAITITYDFKVDVPTEALANNSYDGSFSYDDSTLTGVGIETIGTNEELLIDFNFLGKTYTESDDNTFGFNFPLVEFKDGNLVGLQYLVTDVLDDSIFSFAIFGDTPDGLGGGNQFSYVNENSVEESEGRVTYFLRSPSTSVPEPSALLGLGVLSLSWLLKRKI